MCPKLKLWTTSCASPILTSLPPCRPCCRPSQPLLPSAAALLPSPLHRRIPHTGASSPSSTAHLQPQSGSVRRRLVASDTLLASLARGVLCGGRAPVQLACDVFAPCTVCMYAARARIAGIGVCALQHAAMYERGASRCVQCPAILLAVCRYCNNRNHLYLACK